MQFIEPYRPRAFLHRRCGMPHSFARRLLLYPHSMVLQIAQLSCRLTASKYMVRSVVGEVVHRTNCAREAMKALARFAMMNPHMSAAIYRQSKKGWVIYGLSLIGLLGA